MKSNFKRLGDYIRLVDKRNSDMAIKLLLGINITKNFMPSVANTSETDLSKYKVIHKGQFAYSAMQVGRDETIRVALYNQSKPAIISPAYLVFEVIDSSVLLSEFIMMWFQRPESDRFGWFLSDGSVRASLEWERFCDISIPVPDISEQRNYVAVYNGLMSNQQSYEKSIRDLQFVSNHSIELIKAKAESTPIGKLIQLIDERNTNSKIDRVLGINAKKTFMPSVANLSETDISKYKTIKKGQFAYSAMQVGRDEVIRVALFTNEVPAIISPAYLVFEVTDLDIVLPEFLMMWFQRPETDRYGWFISDGSVRASLDWERFCEIEIPVPSIEIQKTITSMFHVLEKRKRINSRLKNMISPLCPILMSGVIHNLSMI